jgi:lipoprotein-releasing system ATP-binding protein
MAATVMSDVVLACRGLRKSFIDARFRLEVLRGVDLDLRQGDRIAIVGASGTGKSTLLHVLGGLDEASSGEVSVLGENILSLGVAERGALNSGSRWWNW